MKKNVKASLLLSTAILATVVTGQIKAEEVEPTIASLVSASSTDAVKEIENESTTTPVVNSVVTETKTAVEAVKPLAEKSTTTQEDVNVATATATDSQAAVEAAKAAADAATAARDQAQATAETAEKAVEAAKEDVKNATVENIAKAETAVTTAEKAVDTAKEAVKLAETAVKTAEVAENTQAEKVAEANTAVQGAQKEVDAAKTAVDKAQAAVDGDNSEAKKAVTEAQAVLDAAKAKETEATAAVEVAKKADSERATNIETAKTKVENAQAAVTEAEKNVADSAVVRNTIVLDEAYLNIAKASEYLNDEYGLFAAAAANLAKNNYVSSAKDKAVTVDVNNMSDEVRKDLTLFAADLINQVRQQTGSSKMVVSEYDLALSKKADEYLKGEAVAYGFDTAINELRKKNESVYQPYSTDAIGNTQPSLAPKATMTVDELKQQIYDRIVADLFKPFEGESLISAKRVLGLRNYDKDYPDNHLLFGYVSKERENTLGLIIVANDSAGNKYFIKDASVLSSPILANPYSNLAGEADAKQKALAAAKTTLREAQAALEKLQNSLEQTSAAETSLKIAKENVEKAEIELAKATSALNNNSDLKAKVEALAQTKADLGTKETALKAAQDALKVAQDKASELRTASEVAQAKLVQAQADVVTAEEAVEVAKAELARLKNTPEALKVAEKALAEAIKVLEDKQADLDVALFELATLEDLNKQVQNYKAQILAKLQTEEVKPHSVSNVKSSEQSARTVRTARTGSRSLTSNSTTSTLGSGRSTVSNRNVQPTKVNYQTSGAFSPARSVSSVTAQTAKSLPKTGDEYNYTAALAGSLLGLLGVVALRRRSSFE